MRTEEPLRGAPRNYLNKLISLAERDAFLIAVNQGKLAEYFHDLTGFAIASASEIWLDEDGRLFGSKIDFKNRIIDVPIIDIRDSKEITLFNCVILGDLFIGGHEGTHRVDIDNCLVLGTLCLGGNDQNPDMKINIWNSNCTVLKMGPGACEGGGGREISRCNCDARSPAFRKKVPKACRNLRWPSPSCP